jgi:hypothetical protein
MQGWLSPLAQGADGLLGHAVAAFVHLVPRVAPDPGPNRPKAARFFTLRGRGRIVPPARGLSGLREKSYAGNMDLNIEFNQAAFTHDIEEADIRFAISTARYDARIDEDKSDDKHLIIGFDRNVNLLEIMYNVIDEDTINVFHAMKCRKNFLPLIKAGGENNG